MRAGHILGYAQIHAAVLGACVYDTQNITGLLYIVSERSVEL